MDAAPSPPTFGQENFGTARLGDRRRTRRLVDLADRLLRHPGGSLPDKFADPNALNRCYEAMGFKTALAQALETDIFIEGAGGPRRAEFDRIRREQGLQAALTWRDRKK